jgi:glycosyltransferase involved in cell wall biosynthesis
VRDLSCDLSARGNSVHIVFLDCAADLNRDQGFEAKFLAQLDAHGVSYSFLGHDTRHKPWLGIIRLRRLVKRQRIQLIHSHLAYGNIFSIGVPRTPLVYTHHSENVRFPNAYWIYFRHRVARFIGISKKCANNLRTYAGEGAQVSLINNGINIADIPARPAFRDRNVLRAICVGRLSAQKNYPLLARAIAALDPMHQRKLLVDVYGEGDASIPIHCNHILRAANAPDNIIRFCGVSSEIRNILQDYDMFLMSSDWEGLPIALIEAVAAGLPTIVTNVGGCSEVTGTGPTTEKTGIVVPPGDTSAFCAAIAAALDNAGARKQWSQNARSAAKAFSIVQSAKDHVQLYRKVI